MRVAITGGIAEGKSTVLAIIKALGHPVASADEIAREVFDRPEIQLRLSEIANLTVPVSRANLREAIGHSESLRREVNALMHPAITNEIRGCEAGFVEIPLLIETCLQGEFDRVWVVTCGVTEQRRRIAARYGPGEHASSMIATQLATKTKIAFADRVIRTNHPLENVRRVVSEAVKQVLA